LSALRSLGQTKVKGIEKKAFVGGLIDNGERVISAKMNTHFKTMVQKPDPV